MYILKIYDQIQVYMSELLFFFRDETRINNINTLIVTKYFSYAYGWSAYNVPRPVYFAREILSNSC